MRPREGAWRVVRDYVAGQDRVLAGPCWEIYGHARPDPGEQETDIFWLLR